MLTKGGDAGKREESKGASSCAANGDNVREYSTRTRRGRGGGGSGLQRRMGANNENRWGEYALDECVGFSGFSVCFCAFVSGDQTMQQNNVDGGNQKKKGREGGERRETTLGVAKRECTGRCSVHEETGRWSGRYQTAREAETSNVRE